MRRPCCVLLLAIAVAAVTPDARGAPLEKRFTVVLVPDGRVLAMHLGRADRALREGIRSAGGELLESPSAELARAADPISGECNDDCERQMRDRLVGGTLVVARVTTVADRFVVRVSTGDRVEADTGSLSQLEEKSGRIGALIASSVTALILDGGAEGVQWFVDGKAIALPANRTIDVAPGRRIVRAGSGRGPGALKAVDVVLGDRVRVTFPQGAGSPSPGARRAQSPGAVPAAPAAVPSRVRTEKLEQGPWTGRTGFAFGSRERSIAGSAGTGYGAQFFGGGPVATVLYRPASAVLRLDVGWTTYRVSSARFPTGGGESRSAHGGDSARARGLIGYERTPGESWRVSASGGAGWETHRADDPGSLGLLSSYQRLSAELEIAAAARLGAVEIGARLGGTPWSSFDEKPSGTSGETPRPGVGVSWGLQSDWAIGDRWKTTLGYDGELRSVRFSGTARAPVAPSIENATVREFFNVVSLSIGRSF